MTDLVLILVLAAIIGLAAGYIWKAKKKGSRCIGCPDSGCACSGGQGGCNGCGCGVSDTKH